VEVDISGVSASEIVGDPKQLTRAIRNLFDNAERHAAGRMKLTLAEVDGATLLTVSDDGPGIPPGEHERVFERFGRLDEARTRGMGGTGLGLAITREIVERHGGAITVDSSERNGARFIIRFPKGR
jgi:signal transduction histidine kinase